MFYYLLAQLLSSINLNAIKILLPSMMVDLKININWLTWVVNAFTLPFAVFTPIFGRMSDIYTPRKIFTLGILIFSLGSILCGVASNYNFLIIARLVQGIGAAQFFPSSLVLLLNETTDKPRGRILGLWGMVGAFGAFFGPIIAGPITDKSSWRGLFLILVPLSIFIFFVSFKKYFSQLKGEQLKGENINNYIFDYFGALLLVISISSILLGITLLPDLGWDNRWIYFLFIISFMFIYLFYRIEKVVSQPLINLKLMTNIQFVLGLFAGFTEAFVLAGSLFILPIFFNKVQGFNYTYTALFLSPTAAAVAFSAPFGGRLSDRFGNGLPIIIGMFVRSVSFFLLSQIGVNSSYFFIAICLSINGIGYGLTTVPALNTVLSSVNRDYHGLAGGVHNMIRLIGSAFGTTICGNIFYALVPSTFSNISRTIPGFQEVFLLSAFVCFLGIIIGVIIHSKYNKPETLKG